MIISASTPYILSCASCFGETIETRTICWILMSLTTIEMSRKLGRGIPPPFCGMGLGLGPHLTQSRVGWGLPPRQVPSWSIDPFGHNKHGPIFWRGLGPLFGERYGYISNTKSPELRPTSIPSGVLMHPAVCPQKKRAKNCGGGFASFFGEGAGSPSNTKSPGLRPTPVPSAYLDP